MDYIHVYINGVFQEQVALEKAVTTIGRSANNDIQVDNPGVSAHHAQIVRQGDAYFIEDSNSTNGTNVNGSPVSRQKLEYGDVIGILKHALKFSPVEAQAETGKARGTHGTGLEAGAGTIDMDVSQLDKLLKQQKHTGAGQLLISGKAGGQRKRPLDRQTFTIGKDALSDLVITGWFVPRHIARIDRRVDGYYLVPVKPGQVRLNGSPVHGEVRLDDKDTMLIRGTTIQFVSEQT
jgi:pSer/pThr/pTyr-binding forkhead associated (FHA) protein